MLPFLISVPLWCCSIFTSSISFDKPLLGHYFCTARMAAFLLLMARAMQVALVAKESVLLTQLRRDLLLGVLFISRMVSY